MIFGVLPFISAEKLVTRFVPLVDYLSRNLRTEIRLETAPDFKEFNRRTLQEERYDILFTAPHFYPLAKDRAGYRLIVGVDSPGMWAVIVVPKSSQIMEVEDLRGRKLAIVHKKSLATLLVKKHLKAAGIDPDKDLRMVETPSHDASLLSSFHGVTDASALMSPPYESSSDKIKQSMRVITSTESTPHIPISVSANMSKSCADAITHLLLILDETEVGRQVLKNSTFDGFKPVQVKDYASVREIMVE